MALAVVHVLARVASIHTITCALERSFEAVCTMGIAFYMYFSKFYEAIATNYLHNSIMQRQWLSHDTCLLPTCVVGSPHIWCACGGYSSLSNLQRPHPGAHVGKPSSSHSLLAPPTIVRDGLVPSSSIISPTTSSKLGHHRSMGAYIE